MPTLSQETLSCCCCCGGGGGENVMPLRIVCTDGMSILSSTPTFQRDEWLAVYVRKQHRSGRAIIHCSCMVDVRPTQSSRYKDHTAPKARYAHKHR